MSELSVKQKQVKESAYMCLHGDNLCVHTCPLVERCWKKDERI